MAKKKAVSKKAAEKQKSLKKRSGDASPILEIQPVRLSSPQAGAGKSF